ncbi:MAG: hypothetical protein HY094_02050 [Candidatus Melainabacteria bacterium]|nr:hypothetical protein [Candidatus Melainabacteria bacterium]
MTIERISTGQGNPPAPLAATKGNNGEEAFHDLARTKGNSKEDIAAATNERTRLTRTKKADRNQKKSFSSLFLVDKEGDLEEEAVYYTVLDPTTGQIMTLRLLAVA